MRRSVMMLLAVCVMAVMATSTSTAQEPARFALLIGNKGYTAKVGPLKNPHRDVDLIEASLKRLGFKVTVLKDGTYKQMDSGLKRYVAEVRRAGKGALSFLYYSGHGVANPENGLNYLIPVDVADADDDKVWFESFQQNVIIDTLSKQAPGATHYLVFDACRNELNVTGANAKAIGADKGFVPVADTAGLLIAYATAPKRTASDAGEGGGPYAKALAEELVKPGVESVTMFRNVQIKVKQSIGQDPWLSFPSLPPVYLAGQVEAAPPAKQPEPPLSAAEREWQDVRGSSNRAVLEAFRARHRNNPVYAALADEAIAKLAPPQPAVAAGPKPGDTFRDCPTCPEMVVVPAGSFNMGSPDNEAERSSDEGPVREVTIRQPFAVGKFEVTFAEWDACVAGGGCKHKPGDQGWGRGRGPVINVSWDDAKEYAAWLSKTTGQPYRLLTEAEWEYAARGVTSAATRHAAFSFGDDAKQLGEHAWYSANAGSKTQPVGGKQANAFGLHDMHGNVWEWVEDCWIDSYNGAPSDASARTKACTNDNARVLRGGSWYYRPGLLRSADRDWYSSDGRYGSLGFRLARSVSR